MRALDRALLPVQVYGTNGQLLQAPGGVLITLRDGYQKELHREFHKSSNVVFNVPFRNSFADKFTVVAWAKGFMQSGRIAVPLEPGRADPRPVKLMLLPGPCQYDFTAASAERLASLPGYKWLTDSFTAEGYESLVGQSSVNGETNSLATLLNIVAALPAIGLPVGEGAMTHFACLYGGEAPVPRPVGFRQDRFYVWVNPALRAAICEHKGFAKAPKADHKLPDRPARPICSRKHRLLNHANLQFTFYDETDANGNIVLELDIDYHRDQVAHVLLEGLTHLLANKGVPFLEKRTDPKVVYILRWNEENGRLDSNGQPCDFAPLYKIV
jgi:hypothetical protein